MKLSVPAFEHGQIRVFRLSDALHTALETATDLAPLEKALKVIFAQPEDVQVISADALTDMDLAQFLSMAYGVQQAAIAQVPDLQSTAGHNFVVIRSGAFGKAAVNIGGSADAALIATLSEGGPEASNLMPLQTDSAAGTIAPHPTKSPKSDARIGGMVAMVALLVLFALVGLMIWVAS